MEKLPRLNRFQQRYPNLDLRVAAIDKNLDLRAEGIDLGIRYCTAATAPPGAVRLFEEAVVPVSHPSLGLARLDDEATLARQVLLEFEGPRRPLLRWADQLGAMGLDHVQPLGMLSFNQYDQVIQAALAGQGIALGRIALIAPLLADERLVALADGTSDRLRVLALPGRGEAATGRVRCRRVDPLGGARGRGGREPRAARAGRALALSDSHAWHACETSQSID
jgi:LysR family glycine cleavage system transcriptional activator